MLTNVNLDRNYKLKDEVKIFLARVVGKQLLHDFSLGKMREILRGKQLGKIFQIFILSRHADKRKFMLLHVIYFKIYRIYQNLGGNIWKLFKVK